MSHLNERVIVVTGAARGMGAATSRLLSERGAIVVATDVLAAQEPLGVAEFLDHDVTSEAGWDSLISGVVQRFGRLDGLVNNAGVADTGLLIDTTLAAVEKNFRINQMGTFLGMRAAARAMLEKGGAIVNIASCVAMRGHAGQFAYTASKWAIRGMTKSAALELGRYRIRVNAVNPGPTDTPMMADVSEEQRDAIMRMVPLGRLGAAGDMASAIAFLLSDEASFISGAELEVDGAVYA